MNEKVTIGTLARMKRDGRKIVGVVAWDYQIAAIADRAGVEIVSVGDSVGVNLWGHRSPLEVTMEQMLVVCQAVRRAVSRALVSVDIPFGPVQEGTASAVRAAVRMAKEAGADLVKIDGAADFPEAVSAVARAGARRPTASWAWASTERISNSNTASDPMDSSIARSAQARYCPTSPASPHRRP